MTYMYSVKANAAKSASRFHYLCDMSIFFLKRYIWDCEYCSKSSISLGLSFKTFVEPELNLGGWFSTVHEDYEMATSIVFSSRRFDLSVGLCSTS